MVNCLVGGSSERRRHLLMYCEVGRCERFRCGARWMEREVVAVVAVRFEADDRYRFGKAERKQSNS